MSAPRSGFVPALARFRRVAVPAVVPVVVLGAVVAATAVASGAAELPGSRWADSVVAEPLADSLALDASPQGTAQASNALLLPADRDNAARSAALRAEEIPVAAAREAAQAAERAAAARAEAAGRVSRAVARNVARKAVSDPRSVARAMVAQRGWSDSQFTCLDSLWAKESRWRWNASNPSSGAYGIPQALPGSKMAGAGSDWRTNPATQIEWGLGYIADRYGTPCSAWAHSQSHNWY